MEYEIYYKPTYSLAEIRLSDGESIQAERRSMAYMSANFSVSTGIKGGFSEVSRELFSVARTFS
jgi:uncharacterized protein (AIM24 family)